MGRLGLLRCAIGLGLCVYMQRNKPGDEGGLGGRWEAFHIDLVHVLFTAASGAHHSITRSTETNLQSISRRDTSLLLYFCTCVPNYLMSVDGQECAYK